jgi:type IV pilus assembly protein PilF
MTVTIRSPRVEAIKSAVLFLLVAMVFVACSSSKTVVNQNQRGEAANLNMQLGIDYFRQGNLEQAKEKLDRALEQDPRNAMAHAAAGLLYDRLGEADKAEGHFSRAVSIDPKNPDINNNFAVFLCRHKKYERGEKMALEAIRDPLYKTPEVALLNAGFCARSAGDLKRAEQYFRRALAVQPRFPQALQEMIDIEFRAQNYLLARGFLERYMAAQGTNPSPGALWLGVRIERALGNNSMAGDYARRLTNDYPTADETKEFLDSGRGTR